MGRGGEKKRMLGRKKQTIIFPSHPDRGFQLLLFTCEG